MLCLYTVTSKNQTRHIHLKLKGQDVYYFELHKRGAREDITPLKLGRVIFSIIGSWSSSAVFFEQLLQAGSPGKLSRRGLLIFFCCVWCYFKQSFPITTQMKWLDRSLLTKQWCSALLGLQSVHSSQRRGRLACGRMPFEISECPAFIH